MCLQLFLNVQFSESSQIICIDFCYSVPWEWILSFKAFILSSYTHRVLFSFLLWFWYFTMIVFKPSLNPMSVTSFQVIPWVIPNVHGTFAIPLWRLFRMHSNSFKYYHDGILRQILSSSYWSMRIARIRTLIQVSSICI